MIKENRCLASSILCEEDNQEKKEKKRNRQVCPRDEGATFVGPARKEGPADLYQYLPVISYYYTDKGLAHCQHI